MSGQELAEGAGNRIQRIEAQFYRAMASPGEKQALERLREVATSEAIQLVEVTIARDLLAGRRKLPRPKLPPHVTLP
jgi:hypothetical protein